MFLGQERYEQIFCNLLSNMPDLLDLVEEVEATHKPRELRRDNKPVALITPIYENKEKWKKIKAVFGSWSDLDAIAKSLIMCQRRLPLGTNA